MAPDYTAAFASLKPVLAKYADRLNVSTDTPAEYVLVTKTASPFPQHKGQPLFFASVRVGKAYTSFHLMPVYMCPPLKSAISPGLKKRMQGKACFNFKTRLEAEQIEDLERLTEAAFKMWSEKQWV